MSALPKNHWTPKEYLAFESESDLRHEYIDGQIYDMSGASPEHDEIAGDIYTNINIQFRKSGGCRVYRNEVRVKIDARRYFYPDVSAVCGQPLFVIEGGLKTLVNPALVVEVLSPSTEGRDRGEKFLSYQTIDSLQQYMMVSQHVPIIEVYTRQENGTWSYSATRGLDSTVTLESIGCTLPLAEVYQRIELGDDGNL